MGSLVTKKFIIAEGFSLFQRISVGGCIHCKLPVTSRKAYPTALAASILPLTS